MSRKEVAPRRWPTASRSSSPIDPRQRVWHLDCEFSGSLSSKRRCFLVRCAGQAVTCRGTFEPSDRPPRNDLAAIRRRTEDRLPPGHNRRTRRSTVASKEEIKIPNSLPKTLVHLGLGATIVVEPPFTGTGWYEAYGARHQEDGKEGRRVSMHTFDAPWDSWEMHAVGAKLVLCTAGSITLVQEMDDEHVRTTLGPGEYAINAPGAWHTADVAESAVFITAEMAPPSSRPARRRDSPSLGRR